MKTVLFIVLGIIFTLNLWGQQFPYQNINIFRDPRWGVSLKEFAPRFFK